MDVRVCFCKGKNNGFRNRFAKTGHTQFIFSLCTVLHRNCCRLGNIFSPPTNKPVINKLMEGYEVMNPMNTYD